VGIGAQALIARAMGRGDVEFGQRAVAQSLILALIWGIVVAIALWMLADSIGDVCQLSGQAKTYLTQYIRIVAIGMPACSIMTTGAMALHGSGDTLRPALVTVVVNIVNVSVSWGLSGAAMRFGDETYTNPFDYNLHVTGIAIGTSVAYLVGGILIVA
ncbi:MAG: MATE family efflux transporter, partial [Phycisphaerales bacterium]